MQHYGLENIWSQGDIVSRSILIVLFTMSVLSWVVIVVKLARIVRLARYVDRAVTPFWHAGSFEAGVQSLDAAGTNPQHNPLLALARAGKTAAAHHRDANPQIHMRIDASEWITRCLKDTLDEWIARMQGGLAMLASIGSTAPFVGLFGTVWGIYHALMAIGASGTATIDHVAGPVGESLIMTAFGLFVAIPAVLGYNALTRANRTVVHKLNRFAHDLHAYLVADMRPGSRGAAVARTQRVDDNNGALEWQ